MQFLNQFATRSNLVSGMPGIGPNPGAGPSLPCLSPMIVRQMQDYSARRHGERGQEPRNSAGSASRTL